MSSTSDDATWGFGRKKNKIKPGDGRPLKPFYVWQGLARSLFYAPLRDEDGTEKTYAVEVQYFDWEDKAELYLNGVHHAQSKLPAAFPVEDGTIEVASTLYGLKRMHFVDTAGQAKVLKPDPTSAEGLRARLATSKPLLSKIIGLLAILILLTLLPFGLMQLAESITQTEWAQQHVDPFIAPISLPDWATAPALVLSILAAMERALTLRNHWLIDMDTGWFD